MKLTKCMPVLIKNHEICNKLSNIIRKEFDSESMYDEKCLKAKIKSCEGKIDANFCDNRLPKGSHCIRLSLTLIGSIFEVGKNYYLQVFLEECKYIVEES